MKNVVDKHDAKAANICQLTSQIINPPYFSQTITSILRPGYYTLYAYLAAIYQTGPLNNLITCRKITNETEDSWMNFWNPALSGAFREFLEGNVIHSHLCHKEYCWGVGIKGTEVTLQTGRRRKSCLDQTAWHPRPKLRACKEPIAFFQNSVFCCCSTLIKRPPILFSREV